MKALPYATGSNEPTNSYWQESSRLITGDTGKPKDGGIVIVGSGISGVSVAYWLTELGFSPSDVTVIDFMPEISATNRNAGHVLYGAVESASALVSLKGEIVAKQILDLSVQLCHDLRDTVLREKLDCDYKNSGYLVMATSEAELSEIEASSNYLNSWGIKNSLVSREDLNQVGFKNVFGGRFEPGSARVHPLKLRNELMKICKKRGVKYYSEKQVTSVSETEGKVNVTYANNESNVFDAAVIAANAFSPLLSSFYASRNLVVPFKGQIITSKPLSQDGLFKGASSFNHGYEYSLITEDNRLLIGGWRDEAGGEMNSYDMSLNPRTEEGLKQFVNDHFKIKEKLEWEYSWSGLMAASKTGLPFVGPTNSQLIFTSGGYTGHGLSWGHGCSKILAQIILGEGYTDLSYLMRPSTD